MPFQPLFAATLLAVAITASAQQTPPAAAPASPATSTPAKKELVARLLKLQQPGIEAMARNLAEQPAAEMLEQAHVVLPERVPQDQRDAVAKGIESDARKYAEEAVPLVRDRAVRLAPTTVGPLLEEKFTEEELRQVIAILESPAYGKFQQLGGEMQKVLLEKLVPETRPAIEPKVRALDQAISKRLGINTAPPAAAPAARPPARPASR